MILTSQDGGNIPPRPAALPVLFENIPPQLAARPQWVLWRYTFKDGKWTKPPYTPGGSLASSTNPATWSSFDTVHAAYLAGGWDGVGYIHTPEDNLVGGDADKCLDPTTGILTGEDAVALLELDTYTEASPSGTGVRAFAFGRKPGRKSKSGKFELYDGLTAAGEPGGRFLTVTGHRLDEAPATINERQDVIRRVYNRYWPSTNGSGWKARVKTNAACPLPLTDEEQARWRCLATDKQQRIVALWNGDTGVHGGDDSAADASLCRYLGILTDGDRGRMEQLFGLSGLGQRAKWTDRQDYRDRTLGFALDDFTPWRDDPADRKGTGPAPSANGYAQAPDEPTGWEIIRDHLRSYYRPGFKSGDAIYSGTECREVPRIEACAALPPTLIPKLLEASDAPAFANGTPKGTDAMPAFFKKWVGTKWKGLLAELPDEDSAELGTAAAELAAEEFRRLTREALLMPYVLGQSIQVGPLEDNYFETKHEKRPIADWCQRFARPGQWSDIRGLKIWCKTVIKDGGELAYRIALRHEFFSQIKADRRLIEMGSNRFARRCERYGLGKPGGQAERPHGKWALILDDGFVADLLGSADVEGEAEGY